MVPTQVRLVSDADIFYDIDVCVVELNESDTDGFLHQAYQAIVKQVKNPKELIIIDLVKSESNFIFKFVVF